MSMHTLTLTVLKNTEVKHELDTSSSSSSCSFTTDDDGFRLRRRKGALLSLKKLFECDKPLHDMHRMMPISCRWYTKYDVIQKC